MKAFLIGVLTYSVLALPVYASAPCYPKNYGYYKPAVYYLPGYQVGSALREEAIAEKAAQKTMEQMRAKYEAEMQAFRAKLEADLQGKLTLEFGGKGSGSVNSSSAVSGELGQVQAIFDNHCVSCHSGTAAKKGLDLTDASKLSVLQIKDAALKVHLGTMPPKGEPVPQEQSDFLLKYAEQAK